MTVFGKNGVVGKRVALHAVVANSLEIGLVMGHFMVDRIAVTLIKKRKIAIHIHVQVLCSVGNKYYLKDLFHKDVKSDIIIL